MLSNIGKTYAKHVKHKLDLLLAGGKDMKETEDLLIEQSIKILKLIKPY